MTTKTTKTTENKLQNSVKTQVLDTQKEKNTSTENFNATHVLTTFYKVKSVKINFEYMQKTDRIGYLLLLKLNQEIDNLSESIDKVESAIADLTEELARKELLSENTIEIENAIDELETKKQKFTIELDARNKVAEKIKSADFELDGYVACKAYAGKYTKTLRVANFDELIADCEKIKGYIRNHNNILTELAMEKKTPENKNLYINLKNDLQAIVNKLLVSSNLQITIKPQFVAVVCGMFTANLTLDKNTNINQKTSGIKVAGAEKILHEICKMIILACETDNF